MKQEIQDALDEGDLRLTKNASGEKFTTALDVQPTSERVANMYARIIRICEGDKRSTWEETVKNSACPDLAREYVGLFAYMLDRLKAPPKTGVDLNPFRGLSETDTARKLDMLLERLCDRSTGRLGPWRNGISVTQASRR